MNELFEHVEPNPEASNSEKYRRQAMAIANEFQKITTRPEPAEYFTVTVNLPDEWVISDALGILGELNKILNANNLGNAEMNAVQNSQPGKQKVVFSLRR